MTLSSCPVPLVEQHDLVMLDLDGVVYRGPDPVPHAVDALERARTAGTRLAYVTNNASRTAAAAAQHLADLGVPDVGPDDVVTAAQAVVDLIAADLPSGSRVLVVGGPGLREPLAAAGLVAVGSADDDPVAVVQGFHPDVAWRDLAEATYAVAAGARYYASNLDLTVPTARGVAPGNGSLVSLVQQVTGVDPTVAGKPEPPLLRSTIARCDGTSPLMVGDRLDTDIRGAANVGVPSLAVLTGLSDAQTIADAEGDLRPSFVAPDLRGLLVAHPEVTVDGERARCADAEVRLDGDRVEVSGGEELHGLRAAVALAWACRDGSGRRVRLDGMMTP
ncbi:HAD-IIA family hydrolase [Aeromicrobium sp. IC_218]|uniref:HAD-IIA family hydrolase n=1 Tax=Aeromicrobium sp. IC_218 TaxID=2545468 RepID=UPI001F6256DE|nr:HAD-IIA family hydrolase [Aeromicrobium sp. IC_218]